MTDRWIEVGEIPPEDTAQGTAGEVSEKVCMIKNEPARETRHLQGHPVRQSGLAGIP